MCLRKLRRLKQLHKREALGRNPRASSTKKEEFMEREYFSPVLNRQITLEVGEYMNDQGDVVFSINHQALAALEKEYRRERGLRITFKSDMVMLPEYTVREGQYVMSRPGYYKTVCVLEDKDGEYVEKLGEVTEAELSAAGSEIWVRNPLKKAYNKAFDAVVVDYFLGQNSKRALYSDEQVSETGQPMPPVTEMPEEAIRGMSPDEYRAPVPQSAAAGQPAPIYGQPVQENRPEYIPEPATPVQVQSDPMYAAPQTQERTLAAVASGQGQYTGYQAADPEQAVLNFGRYNGMPCGQFAETCKTNTDAYQWALYVVSQDFQNQNAEAKYGPVLDAMVECFQKRFPGVMERMYLQKHGKSEGLANALAGLPRSRWKEV